MKKANNFLAGIKNINHSAKRYRGYFNMKPEFKKTILFAVIITFFTSSYVAFLNTVMMQGFLTDQFLINWLRIIPKTYLVILPFVLITGPLTKAIVDRIFRNGEQQNKKYTSKS